MAIFLSERDKWLLGGKCFKTLFSDPRLKVTFNGYSNNQDLEVDDLKIPLKTQKMII